LSSIALLREAPLSLHANPTRALRALMLAAALSTAAVAPAVANPFSHESEDGNYTVKLGGRIMFDTDSYDGVLNRDNDGERRFDTELRRTRIESSGSVYRNWQWVADLNFNDDPDAPTTEWHALGIRYTGFSAFSIFVGRDKEPFGLEELISSKAISSIERNYFTEATDVDSQPHHGIRLDGQAGPVGWSAALNSPVDRPQQENGDDRIAFTGRLFGAPIHDDTRTLHLGAGFTDRNLDQPIRQSGFKLDIAETGGELDSSSRLIRQDRQAGIEVMYLNGPYSLQSELFRKDTPGAGPEPDGTVDAWYLQFTWSVTGEPRTYKAAQGIADIVKPAGALGALELVAKVDRIDYRADGRDHETVTGYLAGVNWYVNPNVRLMLNYIHVDSDNLTAPGEDTTADVISTRIQFAF